MLVDINDLVKKTVELRSYELKANGIELEMNLSPGLPRILADYQQVQQVVLNILVNAEQALSELNHKGKIVIATGLRAGYVTIAISDNGPGIPESISDKVFQPFFHHQRSRQGCGVGAECLPRDRGSTWWQDIFP
jgi:two-component system NtrC family sensor kinase